MIVTRGISLGNMIKWTGIHFVWLVPLMGSIYALYAFDLIQFSIPGLPVSIIGTAVAFYVGFKNNQSYDRLWEARKIWGGIINESRTWGMMVDGYVSDLFRTEKTNKDMLSAVKRRLIYRHIGWLYAHRSQLLVNEPWEHSTQPGRFGKRARYYQRKFGVGLIDDEVTSNQLKQFLKEDEYQRLLEHKNTATQIINEQSRDLQTLRSEIYIDDFRHMELVNVLKSLYDLQGRNERIKKFPLPRQYANMSRYFVGIFISILPFSLIPEMISISQWGGWLAVFITSLVAWFFITMELVGDYSENPFSSLPNDIPMLSICRNIEIDLREMLGERDLPPAITPKRGILM